MVLVLLLLATACASAEMPTAGLPAEVVVEGEKGRITVNITNPINESIIAYIYLNLPVDWKANGTETPYAIPANSSREIVIEFVPPPYIYYDISVLTMTIHYFTATNALLGEDSYRITVRVERTPKILGIYSFPYETELGMWSPFVITMLNFLIMAGIAYACAQALHIITRKTKTKWDDILIDELKVPVIAWILLLGVFSAAFTLPIEEGIKAVLHSAYEVLEVLIVAWGIYRVFRHVFIPWMHEWASRTDTEVDDVLVPVIDKVGMVTILIVTGLMVLSNAGIDITVLLAGMGIIGIVIGFAAQDSLGNFFAGIMLLLDRPFKIGDYIMFQGDDKVYQVKDVGLRSTKLYDIFEHTMVFLPNSVVANSRIINLERPDAQIKVTINVGVAYGSDVEKVIRVMEDVALQHPDVVKEGHRGPIVRFTGFGDSSLDFILIAWVKDVRDQWEVASELRRTIYRRFAEEGIEIPFPQMDVWIKEMPGEGNVEKG